MSIWTAFFGTKEWGTIPSGYAKYLCSSIGKERFISFTKLCKRRDIFAQMGKALFDYEEKDGPLFLVGFLNTVCSELGRQSVARQDKSLADDAMEVSQVTLLLDVNHLPTRLSLIELHLASGDLKKAIHQSKLALIDLENNFDEMINIEQLPYIPDDFLIDKDRLEGLREYLITVTQMEAGDAETQYNLGLLFYNGHGVQQAYRAAAKWYQMAAEQGYSDAQYNLGLMYSIGQGVQENCKEAFQWFSKAAEQGNINAQSNLGVMYSNGKGVYKDFKEAFKWFSKAAEQEHAEAQYNLGLMYDNGHGVRQDYKKALKWCKMAAEQGLAKAQFNLGHMYFEGQGVQQNHNEAFKWFSKAAEQEYAKGQSDLGVMYENGYAVQQDYKEAAKWYKKAAVQGYAKAQYDLGLMYSKATGFKQDYNEAAQWYEKAAEQGHAKAQHDLGFLYAIKEDFVEAGMWFLIAGMNGVDISEVEARLKEEMTSFQRAEAQSRAEALVEKNPGLINNNCAQV